MSLAGRELRSTIDEDGTFTLSLEQVEVGDPAADEIVVRVEATPINPSDLGLLLGPVDLLTLTPLSDGRVGLTGTVPRERLASVPARIGRSMPVGNEGAGTVIVTGRDAAHMAGRRVGMIGGGMYADYRRVISSPRRGRLCRDVKTRGFRPARSIQMHSSLDVSPSAPLALISYDPSPHSTKDPGVCAMSRALLFDLDTGAQQVSLISDRENCLPSNWGIQLPRPIMYIM